MKIKTSVSPKKLSAAFAKSIIILNKLGFVEYITQGFEEHVWFHVTENELYLIKNMKGFICI